MPENRHDDLAARWGLDDAAPAALQRHALLHDDDGAGRFWHLYADAFHKRLFFEVVQRADGYAGFGAANTPVRAAVQARQHPAATLPRSSHDAERQAHPSNRDRRPGPDGQGMITGRTTVVAHLGWPTEAFKAPMIYNPWFEAQGIDAVVVPLGVEPADYPGLFRPLFQIRNLHGALVTMPHKVTTAGLVDEVTTTAQIAGACNAVLRRPDGSLLGDMFDGAGFVRGVERKGQAIEGARALVVGCGGVGCAIAASLAAAGLAGIALFDPAAGSAAALAGRLRRHYPALDVSTGSNDPAGFGIVVNATPLGMKPGDPLPVDPARIDEGAFVGEVVMKEERTPLLRAATARGCTVQVGTDMLFEMIPAYLEFFGFGTGTPEELRRVARLRY